MKTNVAVPRHVVSLFFILFFSIWSLSGNSWAQGIGKILSVKSTQAVEGNDFLVTVEVAMNSNISQMTLFYRQFGQSEFRQIEMTLNGTTASGTIPGSFITPPFTEFYIEMQLRNNTKETYPLQNPGTSPAQISVRGISEKDKEVIVLSPEKNDRLSKEDLFISISLIYASPEVDKSATKIYLDQVDVSKQAVFSGDLISYFPENFPGTLRDGPHSLKIELYTTKGELYHTVYQSFVTVSAEFLESKQNKFAYGAQAELESRNETIDDVSTWYNRATVRLNGGWTDTRFQSYLHLTSEEKDYRQPQDRYYIGGETSWLKLGLGDAYPTFPNIILNGQRVRGITGSLLLNYFNVDVTYGQILRNVEGTFIAKVPADSVSISQLENNMKRLSGADSGYYDQYGPGTFKRNLFAIRPSFGSGETFQLGFTYMHSIDDMGSINYGPQPEENVVAGSDLTIKADHQRIQLNAQAAMSVVNTDITSGNITDARIDSLFGDGKPFGGDTSTIKKLRDFAKPFITVNENISPLDPTKKGSLAYETALSLNYFGNYLKGTYLSRGGEYQSFGQPNLPYDERGFNLLDRLRLLDNSLFLTGSFEKLKDNLQGGEVATTTSLNYNISLAYYPRFNFPNVTLGFGGYSKNNNIEATDTLEFRREHMMDDKIHRIFGQIGYDFIAVVKHNATFSFNISTMTDNRASRDTINFHGIELDSKNNMFAFVLTSFYSIPLQTTVSLTINTNSNPSQVLDFTLPEIQANKFDYTTLLVSGTYRLLEERLRVAASISPTFGDLKRTLYEGSAQYMITNQQSLAFQLYLINNPGNTGSKNDVIASLIYKLEL